MQADLAIDVAFRGKHVFRENFKIGHFLEGSRKNIGQHKAIDLTFLVAKRMRLVELQRFGNYKRIWRSPHDSPLDALGTILVTEEIFAIQQVIKTFQHLDIRIEVDSPFGV